MPLSIVANAPGSAMLFGEHAVLRGGNAIVAAIDCRLSVTLTPRSDTLIDIKSALGRATTSLDELSFGSRFRFVETVFRLYKDHLKAGVNIDITSSIDPTVGLASSASVTVALLSALRTYLHLPCDKTSLLQEACRVIRTTQGYGSGADAASIIYGGIISYHAEEAAVTPLASSLPLVLVYSGKKTPTPEVIRYVNEQERRFPALFQAIFSAINDVTDEASKALCSADLPSLGRLFNHANGLMEALGVGTQELSSICWSLRQESSIFGAKISGSGLGDAAIALGTLEKENVGRRLPSTVASQGLEVQICKD